MTGKRVQESQITLYRFMMPEHANHHGNIHGGEIVKMVDEAGGMCAMRHANRQVVTLAIDSMTFHLPTHVGDIIALYASVNWAGRTSLEVGVRVVSESPITGEKIHTNSAYLVYVAIDDDRQPVPVPPLILENDEERRRWAEAEERRARRLKRERRTKHPGGER
jgi:acyl-CoA hydrolase